MANQVDGGTQAQGVVSGLDQEELTLREKMAEKAKAEGRAKLPDALETHGPGETPVGTGEADDAFGSAAGGPAAP